MIRKFWQKLVFEKQLKKCLDEKQIDMPIKINKFAVVIDSDTGVSIDFFLGLAADLNLSKSQIAILLLSKNQESLEQHHKTFNPKEVDFWSNFKGELLTFCETEYDLLINYYNSNDHLNKLVSARVNHKFSVGFLGSDQRINDLIFDFDPKDAHTFKKELIKYIQILNNN